MQAQRGDCETLQGGLVFLGGEWPSRVEDEMTLQVALTAKDGVLLASDTCMLAYDLQNEIRNPHGGHKIVNVPGANVAYAFSGDDCAREAGESLETALCCGFDFSHTRKELERIADKAYTDAKQRRPSMQPQVKRVLLVVFYCDSPQLWRVEIKDQASRAEPVNYCVAGDIGNYARFFRERYWRDHCDCSLDELKPLAAHIILMGGKLSSATIEGLDLAVITREKGFVRLSDDELANLRKASDELDRLIEARLFAAAGP